MEHGVALLSFQTKTNLKSFKMEQELYLLIKDPEVRELMAKDGFYENAFFVPGAEMMAFVAKSWYDSINYQDYLETANN